MQPANVPRLTRRSLVRRGLWAAAITVLGPSSVLENSAAAPTAGAKRFALFDALLFRAKPNLSAYGLQPITAVAEIWRPGAAKSEFDPVGLQLLLQELPKGTSTLFVDVESWPLLTDDLTVRDRSVSNFLQTAELTRATLPAVRFGFYGVAPCCVYWPIVREQAAGLNQWHTANRALLPLADYVDFVLPSLYTFYADQNGWAKFATASIAEARIYGRPVYPFLWNQYFDGNVLLRGMQVAADAWNAELELCLAQADGVVLWGGSEQNWDPSAAWWQSVKRLSQRTQRG